jgi:hypothetical protein
MFPTERNLPPPHGRVCHLGFRGNFLQDLNVQIDLGHHLLERDVLLLEMSQPLHVHRFELPHALAPGAEIVRLLIACFLATAATCARSAARKIYTICPADNRAFFVAPWLSIGPSSQGVKRL